MFIKSLSQKFFGLISASNGSTPDTTSDHLAADPVENDANISHHKPDLIDVRTLIAQYDVEGHAKLADEYFTSFTLDAPQLRKPFMLGHAHHLSTSFAVAVENLALTSGMTVVDFGCGTGWLSQALALMGCRPVAVDVSRKALDLGRTYTASKFPEIADQITYLPFDGRRIDLPDGSVDRVMCMDSFHHVANQAEILSEFFRILVDGGRAVFCEPGPEHSRTPDSQMEMRNFGVIENDIVIEDIWRMAQEIGFSDVTLSIFATRPLTVSLNEFNALRNPLEGASTIARVYQEMLLPLYHSQRSFVLQKGVFQIDSRTAQGLAGRIDVQADDLGDTYRLHGVLHNTGQTVWRRSGVELGCVNLGLVAETDDGRRDHDFMRGFVVAADLPPGGEQPFEVMVPKARLSGGGLRANLVAEGVAWFPQASGQPQKII